MDEPIPIPTRRHTPISWPVVIAVGIGLVLTYWLRYVLLPFVAAGALAYVARPLVHGLHRKFHWPRWLAALVPFAIFTALLGGIAYSVADRVIPQLTQMVNNTQALIEGFLQHIFTKFGIENTMVFGQKLTAQDTAKGLLDRLKTLASENALVAIGGGFGLIMGAVLTFVLFAFFLFTGPSLAAGMLWLVPPPYRARVQVLAAQIDPMLARYLRGIFVIVLYAGGVTWIVAGLVFHVSHAIFLAMAVGLLEVVPVIGPILSFVTFGLVAVQQMGIASIIGFGVFAILLRLTIDQVVGPIVLGRAAQIPAVVVMFAFLAGGAIYGILGVILAIPAAATVKIVLTNLYSEESRQ